MFLLQSPPPENPEPLFFLTLGMSPVIDFCIWVLEKDGLRIAPFDQHPDGDGSLRSLGMTADNWRSWITRTALLVDQRYLWQTDSSAVEPQVDPLLELQQFHRQLEVESPDLELPPFDAPAIVEQMDRHEVWQTEQYEKFQATLHQVYGDTTPPDIWEGDEEILAWQGLFEVAERLRELKAEYSFSQRERSWLRREIDPDTGFAGIGEMLIDTERLPEVVQPHWQC